MFADCNSFASKAKIHLFLQSFSSLYWHHGEKANKHTINEEKDTEILLWLYNRY